MFITCKSRSCRRSALRQLSQASPEFLGQHYLTQWSNGKPSHHKINTNNAKPWKILVLEVQGPKNIADIFRWLIEQNIRVIDIQTLLTITFK